MIDVSVIYSKLSNVKASQLSGQLVCVVSLDLLFDLANVVLEFGHGRV